MVEIRRRQYNTDAKSSLNLENRLIHVMVNVVCTHTNNIASKPILGDRKILCKTPDKVCYHYSDVMMDAMAFQITSLAIVYSTVYSGTDQR